MTWINARKETPSEDGQKVLAIDSDGEYWIAYYLDNHWWSIFFRKPLDKIDGGYKITHWKRLSKPKQK